MAQAALLTPEKLKAVLEEFCQQHGGGNHSIEAGLGRYGGVWAELVWDGFDEQEISGRQVKIWEFLRKRLPISKFTQVCVVYAKGTKEKAVEDALQTCRDSELPWMRETGSPACL